MKSKSYVRVQPSSGKLANGPDSQGEKVGAQYWTYDPQYGASHGHGPGLDMGQLLGVVRSDVFAEIRKSWEAERAAIAAEQEARHATDLASELTERAAMWGME